MRGYVVLYFVFIAITAIADSFSPSFPEISGIIDDYNMTSVKNSLKERDIHRVEGIWQLTDGTIVGIERNEADDAFRDAISIYRIAILQSSARSVRPGTIIGYLAPTAKEGTYEGRIFTNYSPRRLPSYPRKVFIHLDSSNDRISFEPDRSGWKLSLRHTFPWLFHPSVRYQSDSRRSDLYGGVRLYPVPAIPFEPVYL